MLKSEHVAATHKTGLDALAELTGAALNSVEKLSELQFQTVRASLEDSTEQGKRVFDARSLHELSALQSEVSQPTEKLVAYGRHLYQIAAGTHAEWRKVAQTRANEQCRIASPGWTTMPSRPYRARSRRFPSCAPPLPPPSAPATPGRMPPPTRFT